MCPHLTPRHCTSLSTALLSHCIHHPFPLLQVHQNLRKQPSTPVPMARAAAGPFTTQATPSTPLPPRILPPFHLHTLFHSTTEFTTPIPTTAYDESSSSSRSPPPAREVIMGDIFSSGAVAISAPASRHHQRCGRIKASRLQSFACFELFVRRRSALGDRSPRCGWRRGLFHVLRANVCGRLMLYGVRRCDSSRCGDPGSCNARYHWRVLLPYVLFSEAELLPSLAGPGQCSSCVTGGQEGAH